MALVDKQTGAGTKRDDLQTYFDERLERMEALRRRTEKGIPTFDLAKVIQTYKECPLPQWPKDNELGAVAAVTLAEHLSKKLEINAYFQTTLLLKSGGDHINLTHRIVLELINPKIDDIGALWVVHVITPNLDLAIVYDQQKQEYCHFDYLEFLGQHGLEALTRRTRKETTRATQRAYEVKSSLFR